MRTRTKLHAPSLKLQASGAKPQASGYKPASLRRQDIIIIAAVQIAFFLLYILVELQQNGKLGFPLDDPWIHLTFAKNLARGWGFAFNHGEAVQGSTAPLWTLILAFFHLFTKNAAAMVWITKVLGAGFLFVASLFSARIVLYLTQRRWAGLAAGLAMVSLSHFGWAMVSGMEVTLVAALTLAGVYYWMVPLRGKKVYLPWLLFALAVYARPESFILIGLLVLDSIIRRLAFKQKLMFWRGLAVCAVAVLPYFVLNLAIVHSLFPQTYVAKVGRTSLFTALATGDGPQVKLLLFKAPWMYFTGFITHLWRANPVLVLLAWVGLVALVVRFARQRTPVSLLIPMIAIFFAPVLGMTAPFVSAAFQNGRYLGPPVALTVVAAIVGGVVLADWFRSRRARLAAAGVLGLLVLFNIVSTGIATARNTALAESSINRQQVAIGEWLAQNTPADAVVGCNDVGAIGYFANRRVLDLLGLVTPELMPFRRKYQVGQENLAALEFIKSRKPDYLAIFPSWFPNLQQARFLTPVYTRDIRDNYASQFDFQPRVKSFAGILITGLDLEPLPSTTVVYKCDWSTE